MTTNQKFTDTEITAMRTALTALYDDLYEQYEANKTTDIYGCAPIPSMHRALVYAKAMDMVITDKHTSTYPYKLPNNTYGLNMSTPIVAHNMVSPESFARSLELFDFEKLAAVPEMKAFLSSSQRTALCEPLVAGWASSVGTAENRRGGPPRIA